MNVKIRDLLLVSALAGLFTVVTLAQAPSPAVSPTTIVATSANVNGAGEKLEFVINRWSTDADRDKVSAAWNTKPAPPAPPQAEGARPGGGGAAAGGGRGGRGGGRGGGGAAAAAPQTPEAAIAAALKDLTPAGYFWTSEVGGYLIRYAAKVPGPAGENRIILLTDKRLGAAKNNWQPAPGAAPNAYEFSLIELRLPAKAEGEGKVSLTGAIVVDPDTKSVALEHYDTLPVTLRDVKIQPAS